MKPLPQRIDEAERRVIAHDALVRRRAIDLEHAMRQRARAGLLQGAMLGGGLLLAAGVLRLLGPGARSTRSASRLQRLPWKRMVAIAWPLLATSISNNKRYK